MRRVSSGGVVESVAAVCLTLVANVPIRASEVPSQEQRESHVDQDGRLKEGFKLKNAVGEFHHTGSRITFYPSGKNITLPVLENLALERIYGELKKPRSEHRPWIVTGIITEYHEGNYLLITRAVRKAKIPTTPAKSPK